jgi:isoleucyl-tRNA synthetase
VKRKEKMSEFTSPPPPSSLSFPNAELEVLEYWDDKTVFPAGSAFLESLERNRGKEKFSFYDGPPFASGNPHHGHVLAGTIKDVVTRYAHQTGHDVPRNFGWDCHGVPVENEINKKHNIQRRQDVLEREGRGVKWYNDECRSIVMRCVQTWRTTTRRLGRWIDFDNDYKTMDATFMESVWSVFRRLYDLGLVYRGERVMPISTALGTPMSKHEVGPETYKDASDPSVHVAFKVVGDKDGAEFVAWTTTPWTLPSNIGLCVNAEMKYVKVRDKDPKPNSVRNGRVFILAEARLQELYSNKTEYELLGAPFPGSELKGLRYEPLFNFFANPEYFRVVADPYVTSDSGTGIVHLAPAFGEDDHRVCLANNIVREGEPMPCPVDDEGFYTNELLWLHPENEFGKKLVGKHVKTKEEGNANTLICQHLKIAGKLLKLGSVVHKVPHCSRSQTPLIYKAVKSWFIRVETGEIPLQDGSRVSLRDLMVNKNLNDARWVPEFVGKARFHEWLKQARDWNVSRNRFWGTPIPIWESEDGSERVCVGSIDELKRLTGRSDLELKDIHREFVDPIEFKLRPDGPVLKRVPELFDCWFESGSMPYAVSHFMFDPSVPKPAPPSTYPADFIAEGLDQTRGWFYTLMVLSCALFQQVPFKNVVVNGLVLAADGKKMSKSLKNFPPPEGVMERHGADSLRLYLINSPVVRGEPLKFVEDGVSGVVRDVFLPWLNALRFFLQNVRRGVAASQWSSELSKERSASSKNMMDQWILAEMRDLIRYCRSEMESYHLYNVTPRLLLFIDSLTNWFVRLNRNRLKGTASSSSGQAGDAEDEEDVDGVVGQVDEQDTMAALSTLFEVLLNLSRLMAPVAPFFAEYAYQQLCPKGSLRRTEPSVHFLPIPAAVEETEQDLQILRKLRTLQKAVQLGRTARGSTKIKVPVVQVVLVTDDEKARKDLRDLELYLKQELNAFEIKVPEDPEQYGRIVVKCNEAELGKKYRKDRQEVMKAVESFGNPKELLAKLDAEGGRFEILPGKPALEKIDVSVTREFTNKDGMDLSVLGVESTLDLMVVVDRTVNKQVEDVAMAREFKSQVQKLRKRSGLSPEDKVNVFCALNGGESERIKQSLQQLGNEFSLEFTRPPSYAVIVGQNLSADPLVDPTKYPDNSCEIYLTRPFIKLLKADIPHSVDYLLQSLSKVNLKDSPQVQIMADDKLFKLVRGVDYEFSL